HGRPARMSRPVLFAAQPPSKAAPTPARPHQQCALMAAARERAMSNINLRSLVVSALIACAVPMSAYGGGCARRAPPGPPPGRPGRTRHGCRGRRAAGRPVLSPGLCAARRLRAVLVRRAVSGELPGRLLGASPAGQPVGPPVRLQRAALLLPLETHVTT